MKKLLLSTAFIAASFTGSAQVGIGTTTPDASSVLDITSTTQGLLPPRMTEAQMIAIAAPVAGLNVYCMDCATPCMYFFNGTDYKNLCDSSTSTTPPPSLPGNITLASITPYLIASGFDSDYVPYTPATLPASLATTQDVDGVTESGTIDFQGTLTTTGVSIRIPYTASGSVTLPAFSQTITIPATYTEDGISRSIRFSYPGADYGSGTGNITATLESLLGVLNTKKLDIQTGIGADAMGWLLGKFTYATNNVGGSANFEVRNIAAIPDRNIADANHVMFYLPVIAADGNVWLNNNLGADYSNTAKASFNLAQQGTTSNDFNAYGSLFQWGRKADGHELINYTDASTGARVYGITSTKADIPADALFITSNDDWRVNSNPDLWSGEAAVNNPCPVGFFVPNDASLANLISAEGMTNTSTAYSSTLKLTTAGSVAKLDGVINGTGSNVSLWQSETLGSNITEAYDHRFSPTRASNNRQKAYGFGVRCMKTR
jgi:hypothetical protein